MSVPLPAPLPDQPEATLEPRAYAAYQSDFDPALPCPGFQSGVVRVERTPHKANPTREHTYWHIVTEGYPEDKRTAPIIERLTRIPWVRPVVTGWTQLKIWWEIRESSTHWNIWHPGYRYVVIVKELSRGDYLLKTGYPTGPDAFKWHKKFAEAKKTGRTLSSAP